MTKRPDFLEIPSLAGQISSMDDLLKLVNAKNDLQPIDFTDLNELQKPVMLREIASQVDKLQRDFKKIGHSYCRDCGRVVERLSWSFATKYPNEACIAFTVHILLHHLPADLEQTLELLFPGNTSAHFYPFIDFYKSFPDRLECSICAEGYASLKAYLKHTRKYHPQDQESHSHLTIRDTVGKK